MKRMKKKEKLKKRLTSSALNRENPKYRLTQALNAATPGS